MNGYFSNLLGYWRRRPIFSLFACSSALGIGYGAPIYYDTYKRRRQQALNPSSFTPYTLIAKYAVSPTSSIFILRPPRSDVAPGQLKTVWENAAALWSVQVKQPQLQIGREYTPIPPTDVLNSRTGSTPTKGSGSADIHLLIRKEKNGEMTTYLHSLPIQSTVNLRGPYQDVKIPSHVDEVLVLAGGTGISPALQVAHIMAKRPGAKVTILWANRKREECTGAPLAKITPTGTSGGILDSVKNAVFGKAKEHEKPAVVPTASASTTERGLVVQIVEEMQTRVQPGQLQVEYFVDEEDMFIKHADVRNLLAESKASTSTGKQVTKPKPGAKLLLVSGPQGFIDYWAGRKRLQDGRELQGPLGGVLATMQIDGWKVWKL